MKRIFIFVITLIFMTGCSNIGRREEVTLKEKESLIVLIDGIKSNLKKGDVTLLEQSLTSGIRNNFLKEEIQNIDFSKVNMFNSKPQFLGNRATNIVGLNIQSTTIYYDVEYVLKNGVWKISRFKERGR